MSVLSPQRPGPLRAVCGSPAAWGARPAREDDGGVLGLLRDTGGRGLRGLLSPLEVQLPVVHGARRPGGGALLLGERGRDGSSVSEGLTRARAHPPPILARARTAGQGWPPNLGHAAVAGEGRGCSEAAHPGQSPRPPAVAPPPREVRPRRRHRQGKDAHRRLVFAPARAALCREAHESGSPEALLSWRGVSGVPGKGTRLAARPARLLRVRLGPGLSGPQRPAWLPGLTCGPAPRPAPARQPQRTQRAHHQ